LRFEIGAVAEIPQGSEFDLCLPERPLTRLDEVREGRGASKGRRRIAFRREVGFGMKWFRSNIKRVSHVALFALAIQFALSFGHFHGIGAEAASAIQIVRSLSAPRPASDQGSPEHPGDICAICVVMAMANAGLAATPPVVVLPQAVAFAYLTPDVDVVRVNPARAGFQPRAPPIS
jgi:hypothetical protein